MKEKLNKTLGAEKCLDNKVVKEPTGRTHHPRVLLTPHYPGTQR